MSVRVQQIFVTKHGFGRPLNDPYVYRSPHTLKLCFFPICWTCQFVKTLPITMPALRVESIREGLYIARCYSNFLAKTFSITFNGASPFNRAENLCSVGFLHKRSSSFHYSKPGYICAASTCCFWDTEQEGIGVSLFTHNVHATPSVSLECLHSSLFL